MFTRHLQDFVSPLILFLSCVASAPLAMAQINTASLTGQILDPGGAAASGAVVMARNRATNVEQTVTADEAGYDTFAILPVGLYDVTVELKGFKKAVRESISLEVGQKARIDLTLEVGTVDETVLVEATVPLLATQDAVPGAVVENRLVRDLPLSARNWDDLLLTVAGVQGDRYTEEGAAPSGRLIPAQLFAIIAAWNRSRSVRLIACRFARGRPGGRLCTSPGASCSSCTGRSRRARSAL